ncbi:MAG: hypothetical protein HY080_00965 [Gammaproteobacteria bacterium]|nr:hypothetical protein [Gammaproteobacteria bacterium]
MFVVRIINTCTSGLLLITAVTGLMLSPLLYADPPPATIFGKYNGAGKCPPRDPKAEYCSNTTSTDYVIVKPSKKADAHVKIRRVLAQGHTCTLDQDMSWSDGHLTYNAEGIKPDKPCKLELWFKDETLVLKDIGYICRELYCGSRGLFEGGHFEKKPVQSHSTRKPK